MILSETSSPSGKLNGTEMPSSLGDEQGVLGCILMAAISPEPDVAYHMLSQLNSSDFFDLRNREIVKAMQQVSLEGHPLDLLRVRRQLSPDRVNPQYLTSLTGDLPSQHQFPVYLEKLREVADRRKLWIICQNGMKISGDSSQAMKGILTEFQNEIYRTVRGDSIYSNKVLPPIEKLGDFLSKEIPEPSVLIEGILHQGSKMLISGPSKMGKTWLLLDLALSIQTGTPFLGLNTSQADVLYINLEMQRCQVHLRCKKILRAKDLPNSDDMGIWNLRGKSCDISTLRISLMPHILKNKYGLIVFDPIYKVYGGRDENSVSDVAEIMNELEQIANETGAALVYIAHQTKGNQSGKEAIDRISGSGAFARDVDSGLIFTAHEEEDCYTADAAILRNFPPFRPFVVRRRHPVMVREDEIDPERLKARRSSNPAKHYTVEEILAHVPIDEPIDKNVLRKNANKSGIALNMINPLVDQAIEQGLLYLHLKKRSGTNPLKQLARYPQELQEDLHDLNA